MNHCLVCGRELSGQGEICPECQAQGHLAPPPGASAKAHPLLMHEVTILFIGLNVLVFLLMVAFGVSLRSPLSDEVLRFGGSRGVYTVGQHQYWRLLTSNYVHFGVIHLALNMYCLWGLGQLAELFYSRRDYFLLYTYTGIMGSLLSVAMHPGWVTSAGASGAVFGVAGVLITTLKFGRLPLPDGTRKALYKDILQFAAINLVLGILVLRVDNAGHLGGLLAGLVVGGALGKHLDGSEAAADYRRRTWLVLWLGLALFFWLVVKFWVR